MQHRRQAPPSDPNFALKLNYFVAHVRLQFIPKRRIAAIGEWPAFGKGLVLWVPILPDYVVRRDWQFGPTADFSGVGAPLAAPGFGLRLATKCGFQRHFA